MLKVVVLSGPSGSGNSSARFVFEEMGYYIVENAPIESLESVVSALKNEKYDFKKVCIMLPMFSAKEGIEIVEKIEDIELIKIILTTDQETLRKRYALSRHAHPYAVSKGISLSAAIREEEGFALALQNKADYFIDTTNLSPKELKSLLVSDLEGVNRGKITIQFTSFGIKNGRPKDLDMFFDVRSIPNPYWVDNLKFLSGLDQEVIDYMLSFKETNQLVDQIRNYLTFLFDLIGDERPFYNVGIACTGGQHRSVFVAETLAKFFSDRYHVLVNHRDINRVDTDLSNE